MLQGRVIISRLVLILFLAYLAGISLFVHAHLIDGVVIVHSHPFASSSDQPADNPHTQNQLLTIASLSHYLSQDASTEACIPAIPFVWFDKPIVDEENAVPFQFIVLSGLRAPPYPTI